MKSPFLGNVPSSGISAMRVAAERGELNPRDIKAELAGKIIADFHSSEAARAASDEFNRVFKRHEAPTDIEERSIAPGRWKLPKFLVETGLAPSMAEARRLIEQGGVRIDGERFSRPDGELELNEDRAVLVQVGKRRFLRVRGKGTTF